MLHFPYPRAETWVLMEIRFNLTVLLYNFNLETNLLISNLSTGKTYILIFVIKS